VFSKMPMSVDEWGEQILNYYNFINVKY